jgi:hypothetical protein
MDHGSRSDVAVCIYFIQCYSVSDSDGRFLMIHWQNQFCVLMPQRFIMYNNSRYAGNGLIPLHPLAKQAQPGLHTDNALHTCSGVRSSEASTA